MISALTGIEEFFYLFRNTRAHTGEGAQFFPGAQRGDFFSKIGNGVRCLLVGPHLEDTFSFYLQQTRYLCEHFGDLAIGHPALLAGCSPCGP